MIDLDNVDLATLEARVITDMGTMVLSFRPDKAPAHVRNFLRLAQDGFYDGVAFHRIVKNFMIQGGCPNTKPGAKGVPGTGGPGWRVQAEFNDLPHERGALSMARSQDPNSAGSQFFLVHAEHADFLDGQYTVLGRVVEGLDVLDAIANVECEFGPGGERSRPKERVAIQKVEVVVSDRPVAEPPPSEAEDSAGEASGEAETGEGGDTE